MNEYEEHVKECMKEGTLPALREAVALSDDFIEKSKRQFLDNPEFRNDLAGAHMNRGIALEGMGTPDALKEAVSAYDRAIDIRKELPRDNPEFRNNLAAAHNNRGNALEGMGTPDALKEAVSAYDRAIDIRKELPKDNPEFRNDLARAHSNRGNALQGMGTPDALKDAVSAYDRAIDITKDLDENVLRHSEVITSAYLGKALGCLGMFYNDPGSKKGKVNLEEAGDSADEGLEILKNLEKGGFLLLRELREVLFQICLDVYCISNHRFIPEIVLEHLDPEEPGSSPESFVMHQRALYVLVDLFRRLSSKAVREEDESIDDILEEVRNTIRYLLTVHTRYFAGTSASAVLRADYYEMAGNSERALEILQTYRESRPKDPEGHLALANFQRRKSETTAAIGFYEQAAACLLDNLPTAVSGEEAETVVGSLLDVGGTICHLILGTWPSLKVPGAVLRVNAGYRAGMVLVCPVRKDPRGTSEGISVRRHGRTEGTASAGTAGVV